MPPSNEVRLDRLEARLGRLVRQTVDASTVRHGASSHTEGAVGEIHIVLIADGTPKAFP
jgi:hypothetical protein